MFILTSSHHSTYVRISKRSSSLRILLWGKGVNIVIYLTKQELADSVNNLLFWKNICLSNYLRDPSKLTKSVMRPTRIKNDMLSRFVGLLSFVDAITDECHYLMA